MARRKLMDGHVRLWGHQLAVEWAKPELEVDEEIMAKVSDTRIHTHTHTPNLSHAHSHTHTQIFSHTFTHTPHSTHSHTLTHTHTHQLTHVKTSCTLTHMYVRPVRSTLVLDINESNGGKE